MKPHTAVMFASTGLASTAIAQDFSLWLEPGSISPMGNFTVSVYADADVGTSYLGGAFGLEVVTLGGPNTVTNITWDLGLELPYSTITDYGYGGGGVHTGVVFGWLIGPCDVFPCTPAPLGSLVGTFTIEVEPDAFDSYQIDLLIGTEVDPAFPYTFEVWDDASGQMWNDSQGTLSLIGTSVTVTPAPAGLGSLLLCGLLASRRTRKEV
ncbi:MAG: hypothetical protein CMJ35_09975 [Phycisphaerae bacterium]|nr:hypothetical protein [Phycisphaerae bacterium]MBM91923.1 hypothetical protein [Phycisphaerae bacterium]HCT45784.1 hypothetical protein [Phycisphaerales bacterium]